jgi:GNAT superfamily N-acetyltransferase
MKGITISPFEKTQKEEITRLLARAFTPNPGHVALFGKGNYISNERFFGLTMDKFSGEIFTARSQGAIVGVMCIAKHPEPASSKAKPVQLTPEMLETSQSVVNRIKRWMSEWDRLDPGESHYHLGPIGVLPEFQHTGVGSQMMEYFCAILDRKSEMGYLETDSADNVKFYTRYKFQVINEIPIFRMPNWFMKRMPVVK